MIGYTSAIGFGLCACRVHPTMLHFFLGVLTFFVGFGLIQQLFRRDHWGRKTLLVCLLSSLAFSIYRAHVPYQYDQLAWGEDEAGIGSLESAVAVSFWILTLMLGSLSARQIQRLPKQKARLRLLFDYTALAGLLALFVYSVNSWLCITFLVDLAINGLSCGTQQPGADASELVHWFGRTGGDFRQFVKVQVWTWPLLVLALALMVKLAQARPKSKSRHFALVFAISALALPAIINAGWLVLGQADYLFPHFTRTFGMDSPNADYLFVVPGVLMLAVYLATRYAVPVKACMVDYSQDCWCDKSVVGWLVIGVGVLGFGDAIDQFMSPGDLMDFWYGTWSSRWDWLLDTTGLLVEHMFYTAEWLFLFVLIPIGIGSVWRRRQVARLSRGDGAQRGAESTVTRWPQIERHQIAAFPFVLLLLVLLITLSIPFGIASFHVGL